MGSRCAVGDAVQTSFGKGVVRELRNNGRLLVDIGGRALVIPEADVSLLDNRKRKAGSAAPRPAAPAASSAARRDASGREVSVDLHGLTVEDALARAERALNEALLADCPALRFIHGRSGGRIRAALHRRLRDISSVRGFSLDPRNEGVTIVRL